MKWRAEHVAMAVLAVAVLFVVARWTESLALLEGLETMDSDVDDIMFFLDGHVDAMTDAQYTSIKQTVDDVTAFTAAKPAMKENLQLLVDLANNTPSTSVGNARLIRTVVDFANRVGITVSTDLLATAPKEVYVAPDAAAGDAADTADTGAAAAATTAAATTATTPIVASAPATVAAKAAAAAPVAPATTKAAATAAAAAAAAATATKPVVVSTAKPPAPVSGKKAK
jgi:hypothetical protein